MQFRRGPATVSGEQPSNATRRTIGREGEGSTGPRATDRPNLPAKRDDCRARLDRLLGFFEKLAAGGFFGKVVLSFQNGKVTDIRIEETKKLEDL